MGRYLDLAKGISNPDLFLVDGETGRSCTACGLFKPNEAFYANSRGKPRAWCKPCHKARSVARGQKLYYNPGNINQRASHLLRGAKNRALKRGLMCTITKNWVVERLKAGRCEVTNIEFDFSRHRGGGRTGSYAPTIDRRDPARGYTPENAQVVCWLYNRAKGHGTHDEVMKLVEALGAK